MDECPGDYAANCAPLFPERPRHDPGPARHSERPYAYLNRSGLPESAELRELLNRWTAAYPAGPRQHLVNRMRKATLSQQSQFDGAFFELTLHRFLTAAGVDVTVSPQYENNLEPDFLVTERNAAGGVATSYLMEATTIANFDLTPHALWVADCLNELHSPDYRITLKVKRFNGQSPARRKIQAPFRELLAETTRGRRRATFDNGIWRVQGKLWPVPEELRPHRGDFVMSALCFESDGQPVDPRATRYRIRKSLRSKAKRYRNITDLVIAVHLGNTGASVVQDALFGRGQGPYRSHRGGFWLHRKMPVHSRVRGVLAVTGLTPYCWELNDAVYYHNPYTGLPPPSWSSLVSRAIYRPGSGDEDRDDGRIDIEHGRRLTDVIAAHEAGRDIRPV